MKTIQLTHGKKVIVDDEDFKYLNRFHWTLNKSNKNFTVAKTFSKNKISVSIAMWKFIICGENNKEIVYKNRNSLDCRKENMVLVPTYIANHCSSKKIRGVNGTPTSKYKGVSYASTYAGKKKWVAAIQANGKVFTKHLFSEKEAALVYNEKAHELYGDIAFQNIIE